MGFRVTGLQYCRVVGYYGIQGSLPGFAYIVRVVFRGKIPNNTIKTRNCKNQPVPLPKQTKPCVKPVKYKSKYIKYELIQTTVEHRIRYGYVAGVSLKPYL